MNALPGIAESFADFLVELHGGSEILRSSAFLVSAAVQRGDICVDLAACAGMTVGEILAGWDDPRIDEDSPQGSFRLPVLEEWIHALREESGGCVGDPGVYAPLILDPAGRLYLHRYRQYECLVARDLLERSASVIDDEEVRALRESVDRILPREESSVRQRMAAVVAARGRLCVITGGPGTGKTTTVVRILCVIAEQARVSGQRPEIALAAPTGKAASRLGQAVGAAISSVRADAEVLAAVPREPTTIHRLLGAIPHSRRFVHHQGNTLPHDVVVVDEASMVDLALMARLVAALRPSCRLILIGDKDQLASVEAGVVLGDICDTGIPHGCPVGLAGLVEDVCGEGLGADEIRDTEGPLAQSIVELRDTYRFGADSPILALSRAVNYGDETRALDVLTTGSPDVRLVACASMAESAETLRDLAGPGFTGFLTSTTPRELFTEWGTLGVLCATRHGPGGSLWVNRVIESELQQRGLIRGEARWYPGRPVMVVRNDHQLGVYNGDVGIVPPMGLSTSIHDCLFPRPDGSFRAVGVHRLPAHETAFAMTVHKSQGSEFDDVVVVLPASSSRVMSRELLYTAVTRARRRVTILGTVELVRWMIRSPTVRSSGLREALWGGASGSP